MIVRFVLANWIIIAIVIVAVVLRTWQLDTQAIFFGDAARDVIVAAEAGKTGEIPLLGIPSSVPRFKQGPVAIWIEMATMLVSGESLFAISIVFALVSVAAVIGMYELMTVHISKPAGLIAAWIMATSPLAVAHARMPYHTNPLPLAGVLFIWAMIRLWQLKKWAVFWAVLAWCFAFQFELAVLPLVLLFPYVLWRTKQKLVPKMVFEVISGLTLGLLPQIIYDITHGFSQLGAFGAWVMYRFTAAVLPGTDHSFGLSNIMQTRSAFWLYGGRILSTDAIGVKAAVLLLILLSARISYSLWQKRKLSPILEITWFSSIVLVGGFLIHSSPSEAYFPFFIALIPIVISFGIVQLKNTALKVGLLILALVGILNIVGIVQHQFFVSNTQRFSYGASTGEQMLIMSQILETTNHNFQLTTAGAGREFPAYFDNLRWWARQVGVEENPDGVVVYIEPKDSPLTGYPGMTKQAFTTWDVYYYE